MADAYPLWDELQAETPKWEIYRQSGGIYVGRRDNPLVVAAQAALSATAVAYEVLSPADCQRRFPAFPLHDDRNEIALFEPSMGYVRASHAVRAMLNLARRQGAQTIAISPVAEITPTGSGVRVKIDSGEVFEADRLILAAGAWTNHLLAPFGIRLPLTVTRQVYAHLKMKRNIDFWKPAIFPVWIDADANAYGFPRVSEDIPGVKIGIHHHGEPTTPEAARRELTGSGQGRDTELCGGSLSPWLGPETDV